MDVIRIRNSQTYVGEGKIERRERKKTHAAKEERLARLWSIVYEFQIISASRSQRQISRETFDRSGYFGLYIYIYILLLVGREKEDHRWNKESRMRRNSERFIGKLERKREEKKRLREFFMKTPFLSIFCEKKNYFEKIVEISVIWSNSNCI